MKLLLYCTKSKPYLNDCKLINHNKHYFISNKGIWSIDLSTQQTYSILNGKIVAECDFEIEKIKRINTVGDWFYYENQDEILEKSRIVDINKFFEYLKGKNGYAIHIKNLHIFDELMGLSEYNNKIEHKKCDDCEEHCKFYYNKNTMFGITNKGCTEYHPIRKAPQNMMYCYDGDDKKVLISIQPKWLCKILNGEKTIEVRKKVLKEMLNDKQQV